MNSVKYFCKTYLNVKRWDGEDWVSAIVFALIYAFPLIGALLGWWSWAMFGILTGVLVGATVLSLAVMGLLTNTYRNT